MDQIDAKIGSEINQSHLNSIMLARHLHQNYQVPSSPTLASRFDPWKPISNLQMEAAAVTLTVALVHMKIFIPGPWGPLGMHAFLLCAGMIQIRQGAVC